MFHENVGPMALVGNIPIMVGGAIILWVIMLFILSAVLQWLWNMTIPEVFGLKTITFWQAFRLLIIAAILFGGGNINLNG